MALGISTLTIDQLANLTVDEWAALLIDGTSGGGGGLTLQCEASMFFVPGIDSAALHAPGIDQAEFFAPGIAQSKVVE
jgi:hypothetical protein